jgi:hypothetical protein
MTGIVAGRGGIGWGMAGHSEILTFLEALDRLVGRMTSDAAADNRYIADMLDLVEAERERIRGMPEPPWPDTLWHDYRLSLLAVERHLAAVFDRYPDPPAEGVLERAVQVSRWLVQLSADIRQAIGRAPLH